MFGSNKPVVLESYGQRRQRRGLPRWLVLLLVGVALGVGGVLFVQERYLPPRLSAKASAELRGAFDKAESERLRQKGELEANARRLDSLQTEKKQLGDELAAARQVSERLQADINAMVASFPPDPRGGAVEVRAAKFERGGEGLDYDVVLARGKPGTKPLTGVLQLLVAGVSAKGTEATVALKPLAVSVGSYQSLRGSAALPEGFVPRQATVHVLDRPEGKLLGMRVMLVK